MWPFTRRKAPEQRPASSGGLPRVWTPAPTRAASELPSLFHRSPRLGPVDLIGNAIADTPFALYDRVALRKDPNTAKPILDHPALDLLDSPCPSFPEIDGQAFRYATAALLELTGEVLWLKMRTGARVTELFLIPSFWCLRTPTAGDPTFMLCPFGVTAGKTIIVPAADVVWFKRLDLTDPYARGRGYTEPIADELESDEYAAKYQKNFFFNDATPPYILSAPGLQEEDAQRLRDTLRQKIGGFTNARKPAVVNTDIRVEKLAESPRELDFVESRKYLRDAFLQYFRIPPEIMGVLDNSNRSTIDAAQYLLSKNTLTPRLSFIARVISRQLVRADFDKRLEFKFDDIVPEDKDFTFRALSEGLSKGAVKRSEFRRFLDLPIAPEDEVYLLPFSVLPTASGLAPPAPEEEPVLEMADAKALHIVESKSFDDAWRVAIWKSFDTKALSGETAFVSAVVRYAERQAKRARDVFIAAMESGASAEDSMETTFAQVFGASADKALKSGLAPAWLASMKEGFSLAEDVLGGGLNFELYAPIFNAWVDSEGLAKAAGINGTTQEALRAAIAAGLEAGESMVDIAKRLEGVYVDLEGSRAMLIARTETMASVNFGQFSTYKGEGVKRKEWLATQDDRTREDHRIGVSWGAPYIVGIDEPFVVGNDLMMFPGSGSDAAQACNCRCTILPVLDEEE